ncbi:MAG: mandelate racemase [Acidimicrobiia bacterium]|nr:mandelate racemase [Acidimicrobiia bacterium]
MKIDSVRATAFRVPLDEPESDGTLTWTATTIVVVEVDAGGLTGLGYTYGSAACAELVHSELSAVLEGESPLDVPRLARDMAIATRNVGKRGPTAMAISAVDTALWDLKARALGIPLASLFGQVHDDVAVYGSGGFTSLTDDELERQLGTWVHNDAIPRVKIKVGTAWGSREDRDVERAAVARRVIGADAELFVDANGAYTAKQAVRVGHRFQELGVTWFEEPVSSDDLDGLRSIREQLDCDIAAGEYGDDVWYFERMCSARAVDCLQADATRCFGFSGWLQAASVAAAHGLEISAHCAPALHLHVTPAAPNVRHIEYFADHVRVEHLLFDGVPSPIGGTLRPDLSSVGSGLTLKRADAARWHC